MNAKAAPDLPADLTAGLRRLKLPTIRQLGPDLLLTAKTQRWAPEEVLRTLPGPATCAGAGEGRPARPGRPRRRVWLVDGSGVPAAAGDPDRVARWRRRASVGRLADLPCGGGALHGLLEHERAAVVDVFEAWDQVDRGHRKLAARGSRLHLVHVSASTVQRVLAAEGLVLPSRSAREPQVRAPWPDWIEWKPGRVWCYDFTHFVRARRVAVAVMDVVSRRWLATLVSAQETSTQIEAAFLVALDGEQLGDRIDTRLLARLRSGETTPADLDGPQADGVPVLIAMSDNGPQMRSHTTREFMAACAIMQRFGRPHTPTDQAWIESLSGTSRPTGRTWRRSATPASSSPSSTGPATSTTPSGYTPASATSPQTTSTTAAATPSARLAATALRPPAKRASATVEPRGTHETRTPALAGY